MAHNGPLRNRSVSVLSLLSSSPPQPTLQATHPQRPPRDPISLGRQQLLRKCALSSLRGHIRYVAVVEVAVKAEGAQGLSRGRRERGLDAAVLERLWLSGDLCLPRHHADPTNTNTNTSTSSSTSTRAIFTTAAPSGRKERKTRGSFSQTLPRLRDGSSRRGPHASHDHATFGALGLDEQPQLLAGGGGLGGADAIIAAHCIANVAIAGLGLKAAPVL